MAEQKPAEDVMAIPFFLDIASQPLLLSPWIKEAAVPKPKILRMKIPEQKQNNWCWAAVSVGIARAYLTSGKTQCGLATTLLSTVLKPLKCCPPKTADCDQPIYDLEKPLEPHHDKTHRPAAHRTFKFVKDEIDEGNPVAVRIDWGNGGSGHAVVISGYLEDRQGPSGHFYVWDPEWGDRKSWRFERFRDRFEDDGTWDVSYTTTGPSRVPFE